MKPQDSNTTEARPTDWEKRSLNLGRAVGRREERRLVAHRRRGRSVWSGFGFFGLIGWSVVVPTLLGAALGRWLDRSGYHDRHWTLVLLVAGLTLGCLNAWRWVAREQSAIREEHERESHYER